MVVVELQTSNERQSTQRDQNCVEVLTSCLQCVCPVPWRCMGGDDCRRSPIESSAARRGPREHRVGVALQTPGASCDQRIGSHDQRRCLRAFGCLGGRYHCHGDATLVLRTLFTLFTALGKALSSPLLCQMPMPRTAASLPSPFALGLRCGVAQAQPVASHRVQRLRGHGADQMHAPWRGHRHCLGLHSSAESLSGKLARSGDGPGRTARKIHLADGRVSLRDTRLPARHLAGLVLMFSRDRIKRVTNSSNCGPQQGLKEVILNG
jgi:hypothetical protein